MRARHIVAMIACAVATAAVPAAAQEPFIGEIRMVGFNFAPQGWALCDGQLLSISQHTALFSLLGTTYGGNGQTTFALPDLRGRAPIHAGAGPGLPLRGLGSAGGTTTTETVNLVGVQRSYASGEVESLSGSAARPVAAGGQPDGNMPPFLTVHYIIALEGIFPSQN